MPFTFSHPAIVLPFRKYNWFSVTGLVIGSMIPDFEFFIRMRMYGNAFSHTLIGLFCFDLPLAILVAFIFHNIIRDNLIKNLPHFLRVRLNKFTVFSWNEYFWQNWLNVFVSILIGIVSHILLDNFTHEYGYFVQHIAILKYVLSLGIIDIPVYWFLQWFISALGIVMISIVILRLPVENNILPETNWIYWLVSLLAFSLIILIKAWLGFDSTWGQPIAIVISAGLLAITVTPILIKFYRYLMEI